MTTTSRSKKKKAVPKFKTRGEAADEAESKRPVAQASADDMEAMMIGYRIATNEPRESWKDRLASVPEHLSDRVRDYLRWAWKLDEFEVHP